MATVAQKTLLLQKVFVFLSFLAFSCNSHAYNNEILEYKVSLGSINAGSAYIKFEKSKENDTYKIIANAKTEGFARRLYSLNDSISVYGKVIDNNLIPTSHTLVIKENSYKANKTVQFNYTNDLLKYTNNLKNFSNHYILINKAKDIFSTLYTLRENVNFKTLKPDTEFDRTVLFANKTVQNKILISPEFDFKIAKNKYIKAREVTIISKRIRHRALDKQQTEQVMYDKAKSEDFLDDKKYNKDDKFSKNISVIITSDERRIPLVINYKTKFGTFKAIATKF